MYNESPVELPHTIHIDRIFRISARARAHYIFSVLLNPCFFPISFQSLLYFELNDRARLETSLLPMFTEGLSKVIFRQRQFDLAFSSLTISFRNAIATAVFVQPIFVAQ